MNKNPLQSISPIDGRYYYITTPLQEFFSEEALFRYRCQVEIEYFIALCNLPLPQLKGFPAEKFTILRQIYQKFSIDDALHIKSIELKTNHDIKAVEYFLKEQFDILFLSEYKEFIHFALTSQDINNTAVPLLLKDATIREVVPLLNKILTVLNEKSLQWGNISMLARTHGQPASPTRLGKEFLVFAQRLKIQSEILSKIPFAAKFGGATGNLNAHYIAYPNIDWNRFATEFTENTLKLSRSFPTTQIEHYDRLSEYFQALQRINTILIDVCRDIWTYIMLGYFTQKVNKDEVGSSAMPHKVNPIDFENAEGNLGIANAVFAHFAEKLPVSRLQRDLTDSTVLRNIGVPIAHNVIAWNSILKGFTKLQVNSKTIEKDLSEHWEVIAEAIQTILRRENFPAPYEALKALTRGESGFTSENIHAFIDSLQISPEIKNELKSITPFNYTGI